MARYLNGSLPIEGKRTVPVCRDGHQSIDGGTRCRRIDPRRHLTEEDPQMPFCNSWDALFTPRVFDFREGDRPVRMLFRRVVGRQKRMIRRSARASDEIK